MTQTGRETDNHIAKKFGIGRERDNLLFWDALFSKQVRMYYGSCIVAHTATSHAAEPQVFFREMTSSPPSWKYDVISEISVRRWVFTRGTILHNFIPIGFETTLRFFSSYHPNKNKKHKNKMSSNMESGTWSKKSLLMCPVSQWHWHLVISFYWNLYPVGPMYNKNEA